MQEILDNEILIKKQEIYDLTNERCPRPATKSEYLALLTQKEGELVSLIEQNAVIITANRAEQEALNCGPSIEELVKAHNAWIINKELEELLE